jgi:hypothetical protein
MVKRVGWVEHSEAQNFKSKTVGGSPTAGYFSCFALHVRIVVASIDFIKENGGRKQVEDEADSIYSRTAGMGDSTNDATI